MPQETSAPRNYRIAVLIDGDNAQPTLIDKILMEASKYGTLIVRRIYGDWTNNNLNGWKEVLPSHAIQPIQQFQNTTGKNSTDSALIIDAMDLLHQGIIECFCLVSSDSDFTRLATRIRESGCFVIGIGRETTPKTFVAACDVFVKTELLSKDYPQDRPAKIPELATSAANQPVKPAEVATPTAAKPAKPLEVAAPANQPAKPAEVATPTAAKPAKTSEVAVPATSLPVKPAEAAAPTAKKPAKTAEVAVPAANKQTTAPKVVKPVEVAKTEIDPRALLLKAFEIKEQENGWATLTSLGQALRQIDPSFDPRTYGYSQLVKLLRAYPNLFQIDDTVTNVRLKKSGSKRA